MYRLIAIEKSRFCCRRHNFLQQKHLDMDILVNPEREFEERAKLTRRNSQSGPTGVFCDNQMPTSCMNENRTFMSKTRVFVSFNL